MNHGKWISVVLLILAVFLFACDRNRIFEENAVIENGIWNVRNKVVFSVPVGDPLARYRVMIQVRNAPEYSYSNLYLFMNTCFPNGKVARDTIELTLADYDGRWLGSGMGSVKFNRFLLQSGVRFPEKGIYRFEFEQAMRVGELKGIRDFGLRIEKQ